MNVTHRNALHNVNVCHADVTVHVSDPHFSILTLFYDAREIERGREFTCVSRPECVVCNKRYYP